jgi:cation:H+ antiporter
MSVGTIILFIIGLVFLIGGAELLVRGASQIAVAAGISPLVVGLTVVAYGTSTPELAVSVQSSFAGQADIALGNVIGSNIANVLLILGISAIITPLVVSSQLIRFDVPLMIGVSIALPLLALDGKIGRMDGILLFVGVVVYTVWLIRQSRKETKQAALEMGNEDKAAIPHSVGMWVLQGVFILGGLGLLVLGSRWLIDGAVAFARLFQLSELIIGLTIVAVGTSLPEIATSVVASLRGQRDIAVGNVVGSNIFNILSVLGIASAISPSGIPVSPAIFGFDFPVMIGVAFACLPIFFTGYVIARWEGWLFLGYYVAYVAYLVLHDMQHIALPIFANAMLFFVVPLTTITLLMLSIQALRNKSELASLPTKSTE